MKLGFIGCGNMAKPIIKGIASAAVAEIYVTDINREPMVAFCRAHGVHSSDQNEILSVCDAVVLAVKPQILPTLLPEIAEAVNRRHLFLISIAAGKTTEYIGSFFAPDIAVARIFPNLNAEVNAAVSAFCGNGNVTEAQLAFVEKCCTSFGLAFAVPEDKINIFGVLGGCAPAYTFLYIDALAKAAQAAGLDADLAAKVAAGMAEGSAKLLSRSANTAEELVEKVCSPGGTTIEGVKSLRTDVFADVVKKAFDASLARDKELAK